MLAVIGRTVTLFVVVALVDFLIYNFIFSTSGIIRFLYSFMNPDFYKQKKDICLISFQAILGIIKMWKKIIVTHY